MADVRTNLMIVGAQKAATTSLFDFLSGAEGVVGARPKEPHFFSTAGDWRNRLDAYHRIYGDQAGAIRCEASTSYTFFPHRRLQLWRDIHAYNPAMKIIYVVRRPIDRILSHFRHSVRRGYARGDIRRFVLDYPLPLAISRYHTQIAPFVETFGRESVLLLDFDELVSMAAATRDRIAGFAGLDPAALAALASPHSNRVGTVRHHRLQSVPAIGGLLDALTGRGRARRAAGAAMPPDLAAAIERALELEVRALERLMERDLSHWRRAA